MSQAAAKIIDAVSALKLKDSSLFRQLAYVDGQWTAAEGGRILEVNNPATQEILGTVPNMGGA